MRSVSSAMSLAEEINANYSDLFSAKPEQDRIYINCVVVLNNDNNESKRFYTRDAWWKYAKSFGIAKPKPAVHSNAEIGF